MEYLGQRTKKVSMKKYYWNDMIMLFAFLMMLAVKFITIYYFQLVNKITDVSIENIATAYEANQLFQIILSLDKIGYMLGVLILPAMTVAVYLYFRRKVIKGKMDIDLLSMFVQFAFFLLLCNLVNDGAMLLGLIASGAV